MLKTKEAADKGQDLFSKSLTVMKNKTSFHKVTNLCQPVHILI